MPVNINTNFCDKYIDSEKFNIFVEKMKNSHSLLKNKNGKGHEYLGWMDLPKYYDKNEFERIKKAALKIRKESEIFIVIGIGGSYLGSKACIDFVNGIFYNEKSDCKIYFVGQNLNPEYINNIIDIIKDKEVSLCVISKSGTTTEPSIAFRIFKSILEEKYKEKAKDRIYVITDKEKGILREFSDKIGYETFVIPRNIGGRYSVLTPVGLLPIAVACINIDEVMNGAKKAMHDFSEINCNNFAYRYAMYRNYFLSIGKKIEIFVTYDPALREFGEWIKQLFGESEGKDGKGIFPTSVVNSTDLHSLGQFIQDGQKIFFETIMNIEKVNNDLEIEFLDDDFDKLNFLSNKKLSYINSVAMKATVIAHNNSNTPNFIINIKDKSAYTFGYLVYFFMKSCAISGYILDINPFDQPGVEDYKINMFSLLGKTGYEKNYEKLENDIKNF